MSQPAPSASGEADLDAGLALVDELVRLIARRRRCSAEEAEEFAGAARLRLVENDCHVLRLHQGRSSMRTYLFVVLDRLLIDMRRSRWGMWRPSAEAKRLGSVAIRLEQLLHRDGMPTHEALETLRTNEGVALDEMELQRLAERLPPRTPRREQGEGGLALLSVPAAVVEGPGLAWEREERRERLRRCLREALTSLSDEDALILRLRFGKGSTVPRIADSLGLDAKPLYRRIDGLLQGLRRTLEQSGFHAADTTELIDHSAWDEGVEVLP